MLLFIEKINVILWGAPALLLIVGGGIYLSLRLRFLQLFRIREIYNNTAGSLLRSRNNKGSISPFAAMSAALGGTMGVGNIAGVATAITAGGAGAVFWMWAGAFFCMAIKYSEVALAVLYRRREGNHWAGGPFYYISDGLKNKPLAVFFALSCILASFGIGNMAQSNTIAGAVSRTFAVTPLITGGACAFLVGFIVIGGIGRITAFTEKIIPLMSVFYVIFSLAVIFVNFRNIPIAFASIFRGAFGIRAVGGGASGLIVMSGIRYGMARGIFSNEAGLGSAPIAHASADAESPSAQGMWGIFEVFFDTIVTCSLTALVILTTKAHEISGLNGIALTSEAFGSVLGGWFADLFICISIIFFAIASIVGWSYYGERCVRYLTGKQYVAFAYKLFFIVIVAAGACVKLEFVWTLSDLFNILMAFPNMIAVLALAPAVVRLSAVKAR